MPKLRAIPIQYDLANEEGETVAVCIRVSDGSWSIRDLPRGVYYDHPGPLRPSQLAAAFKQLRRAHKKAAPKRPATNERP